jgi:phosphoribosylglycinamide formyltransferase-1
MNSDRKSWDEELFLIVQSLNPTLVVSAGFMRILASEFVSTFKVINSHPSLLPKFPGAHAVRDALAAKAAVTGTTIHWVDAGIDTGKVIAQHEVPVLEDDTEALLHERIKIVERGLIVATISDLLVSMESAHE